MNKSPKKWVECGQPRFFEMREMWLIKPLYNKNNIPTKLSWMGSILIGLPGSPLTFQWLPKYLYLVWKIWKNPQKFSCAKFVLQKNTQRLRCHLLYFLCISLWACKKKFREILRKPTNFFWHGIFPLRNLLATKFNFRGAPLVHIAVAPLPSPPVSGYSLPPSLPPSRFIWYRVAGGPSGVAGGAGHPAGMAADGGV